MLIGCAGENLRHWGRKKQNKTQLTNQYIFMSLITGCPKLIPFHYCGCCQTQSDACNKKKGVRLWISSDYMMLCADTFLVLAGLCCCKTLNWLVLVDWECFYLLRWLGGETACSGCWKEELPAPAECTKIQSHTCTQRMIFLLRANIQKIYKTSREKLLYVIIRNNGIICLRLLMILGFAAQWNPPTNFSTLVK